MYLQKLNNTAYQLNFFLKVGLRLTRYTPIWREFFKQLNGEKDSRQKKKLSYGNMNLKN